ncbi:MAG: hypothetical protein ACK5JD_06170 [Mangrovibacterium sp.]
MGTLFNQHPRNYHLVEEADEIKNVVELASKFKLSIADTILILEYTEKKRTNNIRVADGDIKDEQLAGFGELIQDFNANLRELIVILENNS